MRIKLDNLQKHRITIIAWIALAGLLTVYILFHLIKGFSPALTVRAAVSTTETKIAAFDAFLLRTDSALTSENTGYCDYLVENGDFVKDKQPLINVYTVSNAEVAARLAEIDRKLTLLIENSAKLNSSGISKNRNTVRTAYATVTKALASGDTAAALEIKDSLLGSLYALNLNAGLSGEVDEKIANASEEVAVLSNERAELLKSLGTYSTVTANGTGYFFRQTPGVSKPYPADGVGEMPLDELKALLASDAPAAEGYGSFSGISAYTWYVAVPTTMSVAATFEEKRSYAVTFGGSDDIKLSLTLSRIVRDGSSPDAVLLFSCEKIIPSFEWTSRCKIEITTASYTGYRVVDGAISVRNGEAGVWILTGGRVSWRTVTVLYDNGLYSVVKPQEPEAEKHNYTMLDHNDAYIVSGSGLFEGKLID